MSPSIDDNENDTSLPSPLVITVVATITTTTPITLNIMISDGGRGVLLTNMEAIDQKVVKHEVVDLQKEVLELSRLVF